MELTQMLFMLVPTVLGGAVGALGTYLKTMRKEHVAQEEGMRVLMRLQLRDMHRRICIEGSGCTSDDKEDATEIYNVYSTLGGNGAGKSMYQDIMAAKVTE